MNCQEFDQLLDDLALAKSLDLSGHQSAVAHSDGCPRCSVRLANARMLANGLKVLTATTEHKSAPLQVEEALISAFRQQKVVEVIPQVSNVIALPIRQKRMSLWALAAAAVMVIAFSIFAVSQLLKSAPPEKLPENMEISRTPVPPPVNESGQHREPGASPTKSPAQGGKSRINARKAHKPEQPPDDGAYVVASLGEFTPVFGTPNSSQGSGQEIATDFLPLALDAPALPMESGQVIRVQIPRTALASFGLPINVERINETVKADLLLAEDGSARAIRFVR